MSARSPADSEEPEPPAAVKVPVRGDNVLHVARASDAKDSREVLQDEGAGTIQRAQPGFKSLEALRPAPSQTPSTSMSTTIAEQALRVEEVARLRQFIVVGWVLGFAVLGFIPIVHAPRWMNITLVTSIVGGFFISLYLHQRWRDLRKYREGHFLALGTFVLFNAHFTVGYFSPFCGAALIVVLGIPLLARNTQFRATRPLFITAIAIYSVLAIPLVAGVFPDPGVFASKHELAQSTLAIGALFVIGIYTLTFYLGQASMRATQASVEALQKQTRLAAQRKALMDELRLDLEQALRVGGPGRHTDETVGAFKLGVVIGRGGMGEVYEGRNVTSGQLAAVKLVRRELLADPTHVARFLREVNAVKAIESPHIVRVLEASAGNPGVPFLAMELLVGETLADRLRREERLDPAQVLVLCTEVGAGIDAAASAGIVHRDLKPQNLFFVRDGADRSAPEAGPLGSVTRGRWTILDFGAASLADTSGTLTRGGLVGTPSFMAPEQAEGLRVTSRTDLYALAAVAYRSLTGCHPFSAPDTPALLYAVVHRMPVRPSALGAFGVDVDRWVALALAKSPDDRFANGADLSRALGAALAGTLDAKLRSRADALIRKRGWEDA